MPHKIATCGLVHRLSPTAEIAGAANAIRPEADGTPQRRYVSTEKALFSVSGAKGFQ